MLEIEWEDSNGNTTVIDFDVATAEDYTLPATVSNHSVEDGAAISDAVIIGNDTIEIEGLATNTPVFVHTYGMDGAAMSTSNADITIDGQRSGVSVFKATQQFDRVKSIDAGLIALMRSRQRLTVRTGLRETSPCVISEYKVHRDAGTGDALPVTLTFQKVNIVSTERVGTPPTRRRRGQRTQARGNQPATDADQNQFGLLPAEPNESFSHRVARSRGWLN